MLGIVILIYKSYEQILAYVRRELPKIALEHRTAIVNVGSPLESSKKIAEAMGVPVVMPDGQTEAPLFVLHADENLGYACGNNLGADFLLRNFPKIDKILFSNDDIEFMDDNVVDVLAAKLDDLPDIGCIGPKVLDLKGQLQGPGYQVPEIWYYIRRNLGEPVFGAARFYLDVNRERKSERVNIVGGCFHMVRVQDFLAAGKFDGRTFLYWEEELLSARLAKIGRYVYFESSVCIRHYVGNTTSKSAPNLLLLQCELFGQKLYFSEYRRAGCLARGLLWLSGAVRTGLVRLAIVKRRFKGR